MKFQTSKRADFVSALTGQGLTLTDIKGELLVSLARHNLLSKGIKISDAQVDAYIKENPKQFENPALVDLTWVVVKNADDEIRQKMKQIALHFCAKVLGDDGEEY